MVLILALLGNLVLMTQASGLGFDYFSRTNTKNITLPSTRSDAELSGWVRTSRISSDGDACREGLGIEYTEGLNTHTRERPMSLFFQASPAGQISALSVRAWFSDPSYYNPSTWQEPSFGVIADGERIVTITTRDPATVCSHRPQKSADMLGDRLIMNINDSLEGFLEIPTIVPSETDGPWKFGACQVAMSRHWGYPLDGRSESLYGYDHGVHVLPVIPMYSVPEGEGAGITALAFFTTEAQVTFKDGGVWDATGTAEQLCGGNFCLDAAKCEYGEGNSVFHVFFVDQWSEPAQCGAGGSPDCSAVYEYADGVVKKYPCMME
jgi:hypothetical protein